MDASGTRPRTRWQYGVHPAAVGSMVRAITQVDLPVGYALRIEMAESATAEVIHLQYHIATDNGGWSMWTSAPADALVGAEDSLAEYVTPTED
jgi:hypothetical protein